MKTISISETNHYRLPTTGERITIQGLVSAAHLNGKQGVVVRYERDSHRYRIQLMEASAAAEDVEKKKKALAIKPENILLSDDLKKKEWDDRLVHVFCPCHTGGNRRHEQFRQCGRSLLHQHGQCRIFVGVSGQDETMRQKAMDTLRTAATMPKECSVHQQWFVVEETNKPASKSQFQHFESLLPISMALNPHAWLMFLDNDDMYHPMRIHWFQEKAKQCKDDPTVDGFYSGGKLLIDDNKLREKWGDETVPQLELFLDGDSSLDGIVDVAADEEENHEKDVTEYFDFCIRSTVLKRFLSLTPGGILSHVFCDVRFTECVGRLVLLTCPHPNQEWLLMHYRIRHRDRNQLFLQRDTKSRQSAMVAVRISDQDKALSDETGLDVELIAYCRKDIEEGAIQMIERDDVGLEHRKKMVVPRMDRDFGHNIGSRLWEEIMQQFSSYFPEDLARKNRQWCAAGKSREFDLEEDSNIDGNF
jgi:hypothetical protein